MEPKRILVTGGNGFIGSAFVRRLESEGCSVTVLSRKARRPSDLSVDLGDAAAVMQALAGRVFDSVFHLAGAGVNPAGDKGASLMQVNAKGTEHLLTALESLPPCPVVVAGSWTEYGLSETGIMRETDACHPLSAYGESKLASTLFACAWAKRLHRPLVVLRFFNVWGPGELPHRLGASFVRAFAAGERPRGGNPDLRRDFVHLDDAVEALVRAANVDAIGEVINVGTGIATSLRDFGEALRRAFGTDVQPEWNGSSDRPWDVPVACASTEKCERLLRWKPSIRLEDRLAEIVDVPS